MILYKSKKVIFSILILIIFIVGFNVVSATDDFNQTALEQHNSNSNEQEIASSEDEIISDKSTFEVTAEQKLSATNEKILNDYYDDEDLRENTIFTGNSLNTYTNKSYTKNIKTVTAKLQTSLYPRALANKKVQYTFNGKSGIALTDSNGMLRIKINVAKAGNYKVHLKYNDDEEYIGCTGTIYIYVKDRYKTTAPKVDYAHKAKKYFKITVKDLAEKKPVKNLKLKVKIGKKTYKVKTNKKGIAKISTKKLKKGKYSVKISSLNKKYKINKKSTIKIHDPSIHTKTINFIYQYDLEQYTGSKKIGKGDKIWINYVPGYSPQQDAYCPIIIEGSGKYDLVLSYHKFIKATVYLENDFNGKRITKTYKLGKYGIGKEVNAEYTPYKVKITYKSYNHRIA